MTSNTAKLIDAALRRLEGRKTQIEVAREAGFPRPNMISMLKKGVVRLPQERVPALPLLEEFDSSANKLSHLNPSNPVITR